MGLLPHISLLWSTGLVFLKSAGSGIGSAAGISGSAGGTRRRTRIPGGAGGTRRRTRIPGGAGGTERRTRIPRGTRSTGRSPEITSHGSGVIACASRGHRCSIGSAAAGSVGRTVGIGNSDAVSGIAAARRGRINASCRTAVNGGCLVLADTILVEGIVDIIDGVGTIGNHFSIGWIQIVIFSIHFKPPCNHVP